MPERTIPLGSQHHPGVVNLAYCDGSVQGVSDSLDVAVLKSLATRDDAGPNGALKTAST